MINAEKAAYHTPTFAHKRDRTLGQLLREVEQKCLSDVSVFSSFIFVRPPLQWTLWVALATPQVKKMSLAAQLSSSSSYSPNASRKYQELEQSFTEVGQVSSVGKSTSVCNTTVTSGTSKLVFDAFRSCMQTSPLALFTLCVLLLLKVIYKERGQIPLHYSSLLGRCLQQHCASLLKFVDVSLCVLSFP